MKTTGVITMVQAGGERLERAAFAKRRTEDEEGRRTCAEPFSTLLMKWTSCSMVPINSLGRKNCSLDVLRMITEGTAISLGGCRKKYSFLGGGGANIFKVHH